MNFSAMFDMECACEARDDIILKFEQVTEIGAEAIGPEVIASFGVNQFHADPNLAAGALHRPLPAHTAHRVAAQSPSR